MFYSNPPRDLKALLPSEFVGAGNAAAKMKTTLSGTQYRDYLWGSPTAWNMAAYQPFIALSSKDEIRAKSRIISQSWGGWVASPLVSLML